MTVRSDEQLNDTITTFSHIFRNIDNESQESMEPSLVINRY